MTDRFEELLAALGKEIHLPLRTDHHGFASIRFNGKLTVQLQGKEERMLLAAKLGEVPPGRYREELFQAALRENGGEEPRPLILSFAAPIHTLVAFQWYPYEILSGERLASLLGAFVDGASAWQQALARGEMGPRTSPGTKGTRM